MKERLDQLMAEEFIDLVCGDESVLLGPHEVVKPERIAVVTRNIVFEFKEIADTAGVGAYLSTVEDLVKGRISVIIFTICKNLLVLKEEARVREILEEYGINAGRMSGARLDAEVSSRLARAEREVSDIESEQEREEETGRLRSLFDSQTAALMMHFKYQIDRRTMSATVYAHHVARFNEDVKRMKRQTQ